MGFIKVLSGLEHQVQSSKCQSTADYIQGITPPASINFLILPVTLGLAANVTLDKALPLASKKWVLPQLSSDHCPQAPNFPNLGSTAL